MDSHAIHEYDSERLDKASKEFLTPELRKRVKDEIEGVVDEVYDGLDDYAKDHLSWVATERAEKFLEKVLAGDEDAAKALFEAGRGMRYKESGYDKGEPWAHLIHGTIFETQPISLRRRLVEAHADLLRNERIADLESIQDGLERQVRKLEQQLEETRQRL